MRDRKIPADSSFTSENRRKESAMCATRTLPTTIGAEIEFAVLDADTGTPVDFEQWMLQKFDKNEQKFPTGILTVDLARWQGELRVPPAPFKNPNMLYEHTVIFFRELNALIPRNWKIVFAGDMSETIRMCPEELRSWMSRKDRYKVVIDALERLTPGASDAVLKIMLGNATHIHLSGEGFDPFRDDSAVMLMNHLNHWGLKLSAHWDYYLRVSPKRNSRLWSGFAPAERLPSPHVWESAAEYRAFIEGIPQLVSQDNSGATRIDLEREGDINDPLHRGTIWSGVRASGNNGNRWPEYRLASSMNPGQFGSFVDELCSGVKRCFKDGSAEVLSEEEWLEFF